MSNLKGRVKNLEKQMGVGDKQRVTLVVVTGDLSRDDMGPEIRWEAVKSHKETANAKVESAIAEYITAHPGCSEKDIDIIIVTDDKAKQVTEAII